MAYRGQFLYNETMEVLCHNISINTVGPGKYVLPYVEIQSREY